MAACALFAIVCVDAALRSLGTSTRARLVVLALIGISPLVLGQVVLSRYDFWPAALAVAAVALFLRDCAVLGGAVLGFAAAAKFYPAALVPVAIAYVWQRRGRDAALRSSIAIAGVFVACVLPFAILAPQGTLRPLTLELHRPLELESLGGAALVALHHVAGLRLGLELAYSRRASAERAARSSRRSASSSRSRCCSGCGCRARGGASRRPIS